MSLVLPSPYMADQLEPYQKGFCMVTDLDLKSTKLQKIIGLRMGLLDVGHLR